MELWNNGMMGQPKSDSLLERWSAGDGATLSPIFHCSIIPAFHALPEA